MRRPEVGRMQAGCIASHNCLKSKKRPEGRKGRRLSARAWVRVFIPLYGVLEKALYPHARNTLRPFRPSGLFLFISNLTSGHPPANPPACIRPRLNTCSTANNSKMVRGEI